MPRELDQTTIGHLVRLNATERSFIDCYDAVIARISDPYVRQQLEECQRSHLMRSDILVEEIEDLGGERDVTRRDGSVSLGDTILGETAAIARLAVLEDKGLADYRRGVDVGCFDLWDLIEGDLIPEQERTQSITSILKVDQ